MDLSLSVFSVFLYALLTAFATGLGALPFLAVDRVKRRTLGLANAMAAGLMLAASFNLIYEGVSYSMWRMVVGLLLGLVFIIAAQRALGEHGEVHVGKLRGASAVKALLIVGVMTMHSFAEGVGVGVSFGGGESFGVFITTAIAVHNIPEGVAISLVMVPKGTPVWQAALWSVASSLPQPVMAVPAFLFVETFESVLPAGLGFAAGAMIWMAFAELVPDALADASKESVAVAVTLAVAAMVALQVWLGGIGH